MVKDVSERAIGIILFVMSTLIILLLAAWGIEPLVQSVVQLALILVGALVTIGIQMVFGKKSTIEKNVQFYWTDVHLIKSVIIDKVTDLPDLTYLNIHYSRRNDTANNPHRPYYVVNSKDKNNKKAYWVRPELRVLQIRGIIEANAYYDKETLLEHFKKQGIEIVEGGRYSQKGELG